MKLDLLGAASPAGWPEPGCRCASCRRLAGPVAPLSAVVDGIPLHACDGRDVPGGRDLAAPSGGRLLVAAGPGTRPEAEPGAVYDAVLLDLAGHPDQLGELRRSGAVTSATRVHAVHLDHRVPSRAVLERRLGWWLTPPPAPHRTLILGGARSGKSAAAETRLLAEPYVTYAATGGDRGGDPEWAARVAAHRERRPAWWDTAETTDVAAALREGTGALLVDGLGTWLAAMMDDCGAWDDPAAMAAAVRPRIADLAGAWRATRRRVVAVGDEVGLSLIPDNPGGRAFRDLLGELNQRLAAESEEAVLIVAGRELELPC